MIDFIRVHFRDKNKLEQFILNPEQFQKTYSVLEMHSGEVLYPFKTHLKNMEIVVNEKHGYVKNSIHKLNNVILENAEHNHNDFSYSQLCSMIDFLSNSVIDISSMKLTQLEFGLNLKIPMSAEELISESILMHNFERHSSVKEFRGAGYMLMFEHYNYIIKIYDKAKQYNIKTHNILRFEIKFLSPKEFNPLGVYNINDLKNKQVLDNLFRYLLKRFDELIIVDDFSNIDITQSDFEKLNMYSSFSFWEKFRKTNKRELKSNHKKKFLSLLIKYNLLTTKTILKNKILEKFNYLITH